jgi:hypothetical protein
VGDHVLDVALATMMTIHTSMTLQLLVLLSLDLNYRNLLFGIGN